MIRPSQGARGHLNLSCFLKVLFKIGEGRKGWLAVNFVEKRVLEDSVHIIDGGLWASHVDGEVKPQLEGAKGAKGMYLERLGLNC